MRFPEDIADDGNRRRFLSFGRFGGGEGTAQDGRRTEELESVAGNFEDLGGLRQLTLGRGHGEIAMRHDFRHGLRSAQLIDFSRGEKEVALGMASLVIEIDEGEMRGIAVGIRIDEHAIQNAVDGGGCADAERHGEDGGESVDPMLAQLAQGKSEIMKECPHMVHRPRGKESAQEEIGALESPIDIAGNGRVRSSNSRRDVQLRPTSFICGQKAASQQVSKSAS